MVDRNAESAPGAVAAEPVGRRFFDRLTLIGIAVGIAILIQPLWRPGFRVGFFVILFFVIAQIVASHRLRETRP